MTFLGLELKDWIFIVLGIGQLGYAALTFHGDRARIMRKGKQPRRPLVIIALFMLLTWTVAGFDYYDRHKNALRPDSSMAYVTYWGVTSPSTYSMIVDSADLVEYKNDHKLMLIVRVDYSNVDRMTDKFIGKSDLYTITGDKILMAWVGNVGLRVVPNVPITIEFNLVLLPSIYSADQIVTLSDVEHLGGKILRTVAAQSTFTLLPSSTSPPAVKPQVQ